MVIVGTSGGTDLQPPVRYELDFERNRKEITCIMMRWQRMNDS